MKCKWAAANNLQLSTEAPARTLGRVAPRPLQQLLLHRGCGAVLGQRAVALEVRPAEQRKHDSADSSGGGSRCASAWSWAGGHVLPPSAAMYPAHLTAACSAPCTCCTACRAATRSSSTSSAAASASPPAALQTEAMCTAVCRQRPDAAAQLPALRHEPCHQQSCKLTGPAASPPTRACTRLRHGCVVSQACSMWAAADTQQPPAPVPRLTACAALPPLPLGSGKPVGPGRMSCHMQPRARCRAGARRTGPPARQRWCPRPEKRNGSSGVAGR